MSLSEIIDILLDGSKQEIEDLSQTAPSTYYQVYDNDMTVSYGIEMARMHGLHHTPNCCRYFGDQHTF